MKRYVLSDAELADAMAGLSGWSVKSGKLHKTFKFASFAAAIGWMVSVAIHADKMDHHPEWKNVYNRVEVDLVTHDLGNQISSWDVDLAKVMNDLSQSWH